MRLPIVPPVALRRLMPLPVLLALDGCAGHALDRVEHAPLARCD